MINFSTKKHVKYYGDLDIILVILVSSLCLLASTYLLLNGGFYETNFVSFLPLFYLISINLVVFVSPLSSKSIFHYVILGIGFIRYVVHPILTSYLGGYEGRSSLPPSHISYDTAAVLMIYELCTITFLLMIYDSYKNKKKHVYSQENDKNRLIGIRLSLLIFIIAVFLLVGNWESIFIVSFLIPLNPEGFDIAEVSTLSMFIAFFFIVSKQMLTVNLLYFFSKKYKNGRKSFLFFAYIVILINICIYFGTNRTDILVSAIVTFMFFRKYFGSIASKSLILLIPMVLTVLQVVTSFREYSNVGQTNPIVKFNDYSQTYFGGLYNVAIGVEIEQFYPEASNLNVLVFDILRPMIGVNILVKNWDLKYSNIYFNDRIWRHVDRRSQILPMVAQSYLYFGMLGAPILTILFFIVFVFIEKSRSSKIQNEELKFFLTLCVIRLGFMYGQNSMNLINDLSMNLFIILSILFLIRSARSLVMVVYK